MGSSLLTLFVLAIPVACVSWTVTQEELFREPREWCVRWSKDGSNVLVRKWFYLFTCEYCFSHYVTAAFIYITRFTLLETGWRGYLIAGLSLVWIANLYMGIYSRLRLEIKHERLEVKEEEQLLRTEQGPGSAP